MTNLKHPIHHHHHHFCNLHLHLHPHPHPHRHWHSLHDLRMYSSFTYPISRNEKLWLHHRDDVVLKLGTAAPKEGMLTGQCLSQNRVCDFETQRCCQLIQNIALGDALEDGMGMGTGMGTGMGMGILAAVRFVHVVCSTGSRSRALLHLEAACRFSIAPMRRTYPSFVERKPPSMD